MSSESEAEWIARFSREIHSASARLFELSSTRNACVKRLHHSTLEVFIRAPREPQSRPVPRIMLLFLSVRSAVHILYVEDDVALRYGIARELRSRQHVVYEADHAEAALVLLAEQHVDVIVTDIRLPGESGEVFAAEARTLRPHVRLILCTGLGWFKQSGDPDVDLRVLRKPFSLERLLAELDQPLPVSDA